MSVRCATSTKWRRASSACQGAPVDDELDAVDGYEQPPELLRCGLPTRIVEEQLYSHLLKSNCPILQPAGLGTLVVDYRGPALDPASLLGLPGFLPPALRTSTNSASNIYLDLQRLQQPRGRSSCRTTYAVAAWISIPTAALTGGRAGQPAWCASNPATTRIRRSPGHAGAFHFGKSFRYPCWPGSARWSGACRRRSGKPQPSKRSFQRS